MPNKSRANAKPGSVETTPPPAAVRVLKKYPNRRLYDTQSSSYITLADVKQMVLEGQPFEVRDAKDGGDLTRSILLQIILEEESGGVPMFSTETLAQIIRFYGHTLQGAMGAWFEQNMKAFAEMQGRVLGGAATPPAMPNLMGSYFEQSQALFKKMQEQTGSLFPGFTPPKK
jgi:polyhydroxyalkanoate synthesis repressor PhaR